MTRKKTPENMLLWIFEPNGECLYGPELAYGINGVEVDITDHIDGMILLSSKGGILGENKETARKIGQKIHDAGEEAVNGAGFDLMQEAYNALRIAYHEIGSEDYYSIDCAWDGAGEWKW